MSAADVNARWAAFLAKIQTAYTDLMAEAAVGCLAVLDASELDPIPMSNAWNGIRAEVFALTERIATTWREKVEATFEAAGVEGAELHAFEMKGRELADRLRFALELAEIEIYGDAADVLLAAARAEMAVTFCCTQCGAKLPVPESAFRSVHVVCEFCRSVNTFEPGTRVRMVEHFCAHHLSQRAALAEWSAWQRAERMGADVPAATHAYWSKYLHRRAALVPDYAKDLEKDLAARTRLTR